MTALPPNPTLRVTTPDERPSVGPGCGDVVVTVPQPLWWDWLWEEGAAGRQVLAGDPSHGQEFHFALRRASKVVGLEPGGRVYVVGHGRLRGYAPLVRQELCVGHGGLCLVRGGDAVDVTLPAPVMGFRAMRWRWWPLAAECPWPDDELWFDESIPAPA